MNYKIIYDRLIVKAKNRNLSKEVDTEKYHTIPKCLRGSNDLENLVSLTTEEHYVAHQLLIKLYPSHLGIIFAATVMSGGNKAYNNSQRNKS
jgi:hypothetical protein